MPASTSTRAPPPAKASQDRSPAGPAATPAITLLRSDEAGAEADVGCGRAGLRWERRSARSPRRPGALARAAEPAGFETVDGVIPAPNSGGFVEFAADLRPEVSLRAAETGIAYCLPAGDRGSTCTPGSSEALAGASPGASAMPARIVGTQLATRTRRTVSAYTPDHPGSALRGFAADAASEASRGLSMWARR